MFPYEKALCFGDTIVPKRRANDRWPATPEGKREFFINRLEEAMHYQRVHLAELSVPEDLWKCSDDVKAMLLP